MRPHVWNVGIIVVAGLSLVLGVPSAPAAEESESQDPIVIDSDTFERWRDLLESTPRVKTAVRSGEDPQAAVLRTIAVAPLAIERWGELVAEGEREALRERLHRDEVRRTYLNQVLLPMVEVDPAEVRAVFDAHPDGFQRPEGARTLELFLWAPDDDPDGRAEARRLLEKVSGTITSIAEFKAAAREHSDATSAYRGGAIGTVSKNSVNEQLRDVLFNGRTGLTEIVESGQGLYLFYVTDLVPARPRSYERAAPRIEKKLRRERFEALREQDLGPVLAKHEVRIVPLPADSDTSSVAVTLGEERMTVGDLGLDTSLKRDRLEARIAERAQLLAYERELGSRGIDVPRAPQPAYDYSLFEMVMARAVAAEWERADRREPLLERARAEVPVPRVERWSFDLLRVREVDSARVFFQIFRLWDRVQPDGDLAGLKRLVETDAGLTCSIERYDSVTDRSVAGLGPEIHTRLQRYLERRELSAPLHLRETSSVVVLHLRARGGDSEAAEALHERRATAHARQLLRKALENELLAGREVRLEPSTTADAPHMSGGEEHTP